ncbi:ABC transporter permease|uniref:Putative spermidine/putrescine transport system permease protein n=1 Tax=Dendrosporobacter quercicolus TaxID=146817 RepID=A0A1G9SP75_9FIRM|nr:ABC transporter permease [Dendrosporobacter quercicolus]NSL48671.1 ABC transporter permease [Dendrosporobacter quercicolus DSM 1736]SDM36625.1 putative spermidine/putrescine transport system permease protein [Dendrosporobacter quercicolus]
MDTTMLKHKKKSICWTPYLLMLPLLILMIGGLLIPLLNSFYISFTHYVAPAVYDSQSFTFANYMKFFETPNYITTLWRTIRISILSTLFCLLLGYPAAYYMSKLDGKKQQIYVLIYLTPWLINVAVKAFGWTILLANDGIINHALMYLHMIEKPLQMLYTEGSITIGVIHGCLILAVLPMYTSIKAIDPNLKYAAANLGAKPMQIFFKITLPLSRTGILAGGLIVFATTMAAYTTPVLLGGGRNRVLSYLVYEQSNRLMNWPMGAAIAFIIVIIAVLLIMAIQKNFEANKRRRDLL